MATTRADNEAKPDAAGASSGVEAGASESRFEAELGATSSELELIRELADQIDRFGSENEGLAVSLLQAYEQLGMMFELANEIAALTDPDALTDRLIQHVATLIPSDELLVLHPDGGVRRFDSATRALREPVAVIEPEQVTLAASLFSSMSQGQRDAGRCRASDHELICPVSMDPLEPALVVMRRDSGEAFTAPDIRLFEALLTFGANFIDNAKLHARMERVSYDALRALVQAIDKKDRYTHGHSQRVGLMARITGAEMGLDTYSLEQLEWAALLHDIGKIGVPEEILNKPGKLTDAEFEVIKQHPQMGCDILKPVKAFEGMLSGVLYHHENEDGTGYPRGLRGDDIPLFGRIIHVVDVFDACSSTRSYRNAHSYEKAISIVRAMSGEKMMPAAVEAFVSAIERYAEEQPQAYAETFAHLRHDLAETSAVEQVRKLRPEITKPKVKPNAGADGGGR